MHIFRSTRTPITIECYKLKLKTKKNLQTLICGCTLLAGPTERGDVFDSKSKKNTINKQHDHLHIFRLMKSPTREKFSAIKKGTENEKSNCIFSR